MLSGRWKPLSARSSYSRRPLNHRRVGEVASFLDVAVLRSEGIRAPTELTHSNVGQTVSDLARCCIDIAE